ncbi:hypothetical protein SLE2022_320330 [Rubroshorea leprosula]
MKYVERNSAFYLTSFDHFGNNWASFQGPSFPPMPIQVQKVHRSLLSTAEKHGASSNLSDGESPNLLTAMFMVGAVKSLLVGPPMTKQEQGGVYYFMQAKDSHEMLRIMEIIISLLYELLHTKLPLVDSKIGYIC